MQVNPSVQNTVVNGVLQVLERAGFDEGGNLSAQREPSKSS